MLATPLGKPLAVPTRIVQGLPDQGGRLYAIAFDVDTDTLQRSYPGSSWTNAYTEIQRVLARHGFSRQQGSVYFGGTQVNAVTCVLPAVEQAAPNQP